jgi:hypothetical protein
MTDSVYRIGWISKRSYLSIFLFPSFSGVVNKIRFTINSKTEIESDSWNRNANENHCVNYFLATGSAIGTSYGLAKQMGT